MCKNKNCGCNDPCKPIICVSYQEDSCADRKLTTSNTTHPTGYDNVSIITPEVNQISAYTEHLEFVNSPEPLSGIKGHSVLRLSSKILTSLFNIFKGRSVGSGAKVYKGATTIGTNVFQDFKSIKNSQSIDINESADEITPSVNTTWLQSQMLTIPTVDYPVIDGINSGTGIPVYNGLNSKKIKLSSLKSNTLQIEKDEDGTININSENVQQISLQNLINSQELNLGWKNGDRRLLKTAAMNTVSRTDNVYSRNGFISYGFPTVNTSGQLVYSSPVLEIQDISNLVIDIPNFDKIKKFNPKLVITRFRNTKTKSQQKVGMKNNHYSTAKFRISKHNFPFRPSEIALNSGYQVLDIGQENYFNVLSYDDERGPNSIDMINTRGCNARYSSKYITNNVIVNYKAWTYLEFRLQITEGSKTYLSKPLNKLKLFLELKVNNLDNRIINSKIKFKFA